MEHNTFPALLQALLSLLEAQRSMFRQERIFLRVISLLLGEVFVFARHTMTQSLLALGLTDVDWSAWYRLFSRGRFRPVLAAAGVLRATLAEVAAEGPYVIGVDGVQVPRQSQKMPGTSWLKASGTAPFQPGLHRAQRYVNVSWLVPLQAGYSRAIPLEWLPAFPAKAVPSCVAPRSEWETGLVAVQWVRRQLDEAGRQAQPLLVLGDGSFEKVVEFWQGLPGRSLFLGRTARNRVLYHLPQYKGVGRPPSYGERAPCPADWLRHRRGWEHLSLTVRGHPRDLPYRVLGPYVRDGLPDRPVFLLVVGGCARHVQGRPIRREPAFYLVSATRQDHTWRLPLPVADLLAWAWQRWELEVEHRELKSGWGLGEKQCWNRRAAVSSVQWSAWVYALLLLAGYRTWGLCHGPTPPGRWRRGAKRWSFNTLWRGYRAALWQTPDFQAVWTASGDNWLKKGDRLATLWNAVAGAARA